jgi:hypothetical protein
MPFIATIPPSRATGYKEHFLQQSVLRVDDPRAVRVGF